MPRSLALIALAVPIFAADAHAACPATGDWVRKDTDAIIEGYVAKDGNSVNQAFAGLTESVDCLSQSLTPSEAARAHLALALYAYQTNDADQTLSNLRAAFAAKADLELPEELTADPESPLVSLIEQAKTAGPGPAQPVPVQDGFSWVVDGTADAPLPSERATMTWLRAQQGDVVRSKYFPTGGVPAELAGAENVAVGAVIIGQKTTALSGEAPLSRTLMYGAGGAAAASLLSMAIAGSIKGSYVNAPPEDGLLQGRVTSNRVIGYTGVGLGIGAVGLAGTSLVINRW